MAQQEELIAKLCEELIDEMASLPMSEEEKAQIGRLIAELIKLTAPGQHKHSIWLKLKRRMAAVDFGDLRLWALILGFISTVCSIAALIMIFSQV